jgi:3-oxoacyl-[acyl-carrier protein] reductase
VIWVALPAFMMNPSLGSGSKWKKRRTDVRCVLLYPLAGVQKHTLKRRSRSASAAATVAAIEEAGSRAIDARADVSQPDEIEALLDTARSFTLQKAARMVDSGGPIVYIGSSSTLRPTAGFGLYTTSKLPASFLVGVLAQEIGDRGVAVNAVIRTATDGAGYFTESKADDPLRRFVQNASPLGSRMGSVDDVADAVEFFTGPLARWISGQHLLVLAEARAGHQHRGVHPGGAGLPDEPAGPARHCRPSRPSLGHSRVVTTP